MEDTDAASEYHHGDLRAALVQAALGMLEAGEAFSLRAVARRAGVSTAAPYRHFPDREALESALAVLGLRELMEELAGDEAPPATADGIADLAVRYVRFALRRPALFRLMFGQPCNDQDDERVRAARVLHDYLETTIARAFPHVDAAALATAGWSLAHGLAFLHLDGKLPNTDPGEIDARVRTALATILTPLTTSESRPS